MVYNIQVIYFSTAMKKGDFMLKWVTHNRYVLVDVGCRQVGKDFLKIINL